MKIVLVIIGLSFLKLIKCQLQSPCPEVFEYKNDGYEKYGLVTYKGAQSHQNYAIEIQMSVPGNLPSSFSGRITLVGGTEEATESIQRKNEILYKVIFPDEDNPPTINEIRVNNQIICSGGENSRFGVVSITLQHKFQASQSLGPVQTVYINNPDYSSVTLPITTKPTRPTLVEPQWFPPPMEHVQPKPTVSNVTTTANKQSSLSLSDICGTTGQVTKPLVSGGEAIVKGSWPWLVAIYVKTLRGSEFQCGGNLVTTRSVITSSHCIKYKERNYRPRNIQIVAGLHNRNIYNEEYSVYLNVERILVHPSWLKQTKSYIFDADLALIILKSFVEFNEYIRPICLWKDDPDLSKVVGKAGTVVGWGETENRELSAVPKRVSVNIVDSLECYISSPGLIPLSSNRTFCAGNRNGEGPCRGDSGGGLALQIGGRWTLRGTVSVALSDKSNCDLKNYILYTDIAKFIDWLDLNIV